MGESVRRKRTEHRYAKSVHARAVGDLRTARRHAGEILSKAEVLRLFGYSPTTYIHDTTVKSSGLVVRVGRDSYKVVAPRA